MIYERHQNGFTVSDDPSRLDVGAIHDYLANDSYWAQEIPKEVVIRALQNSLCFGLYEGGRQIGLARMITDRATFAYLCDVYVHPDYQGKGLGKWLMRCVMEHPDLAGLRRMHLVTRDAHELYAQLGYSQLASPERHMELTLPDIYKRKG